MEIPFNLGSFRLIVLFVVLLLCFAEIDSANLQRQRRDSPLIGGLRDVEQDQLPDLQSKLVGALLQLSQQENGAQLEVHRVISAQKQVVGGMKYIILAELKSPEEVKNCTAKIWERLWEEFQQTDISCEEKNYRVTKTRAKRQIRGGRSPVEEHEIPELQAKLVSALLQLGQQENGAKLEVKRIISAEKQVVGGRKFYIDAELASPEEVKNCKAEIYERLWEDFQETTVACDDKNYSVTKTRARRQVLGGTQNVEESELPQLQVLLAESLVQLGQQENGAKLEVHRVISATKQVVAGNKYVIEAELKSPEEIKNCTAEIWEKSWEEFRQTDVKCAEKNYRVTKTRAKRQIPGGLSPVEDHELPELQAKLVAALTQLGQQENGAKLEVQRIISAQKQVVAGFKYIIEADLKSPEEVKQCTAEIWEKSWEEFQQTDVKCAEKNYRVTKTRAKRQVYGGLQNVEESELPALQTKLVAALVQLSQQENGAKLEVKRVISAQKQVVSGYKYIIEAELESPEEVKRCTADIWEKAGEDVDQIDVTCDEKSYRVIKSRARRDILVGAPSEVSGDDLKNVESSVLKSLIELSGQENGAQLSLLKINSATSQLVAGIKYRIDADFEEDSKKKHCIIDLWEQGWSGLLEADFHCDEAQKYTVRKAGRAKRDVATGAREPVDEETLEKLKGKLVESFAQLSQENGTSLTVEKVLGATKQVVAGVSYEIRAEITTPEGTKTCTVNIWEKPWINFRQTDVNCDKQNYQIISDGRQKRSFIRPLLEDEEEELDEEDILFDNYKAKYGKVYESTEELGMRRRIFKQNLFIIRQLNKFEMGTAIYGVSEFADLTNEEYKLRTGLVMRDRDNEIPNPPPEIPDIELPKSFDWREKGAVTAVKNQGNCGSCWAFSVTGNIEGLHAVKTGSLESYSEQELVDCDKIDSACNGGLPDDAYKAIEEIGGLELENEYPYSAKKSQCHFNTTQVHVRVRGAVDFKPKDEEGIAKWLSVNGPVSIGINANAMQFYRGGVSHPWKALCSAKSLDHGVLLVGFGISEYPLFNKTMPYWIVKNSWGPRWGEQGYYRVYRGDNSCGVSSMASSAVLA